jgi:hypothetical protein
MENFVKQTCHWALGHFTAKFANYMVTLNESGDPFVIPPLSFHCPSIIHLLSLYYPSHYPSIIPSLSVDPVPIRAQRVSKIISFIDCGRGWLSTVTGRNVLACVDVSQTASVAGS